ncbi:MAG TPA: alanine--tRNA ligase [archaeon]|nr:alanine--tRNA ligase [archaeon]
MADKQAIIEEMRKNPDRYWKVKLFAQEGFKRRQCSNCKKFFWTLTDQQKCNDASCRTYDFIGNPPASKPMDYIETWKAIEKFFKKQGHTSIKPYPILCRWLPGLYFVIAGIVDFLRMDNGKISFDLPANPLILPQPSLRFNDVVNTGINGKSYTAFSMIQQTAMYDGKQGYWKDECMELDFGMLTKILGIPKEEIVFMEDVWVGPSAFGSSLEYHVQGLELGNAVFTEFEGTIDNHKEMKEKIIDMGAGHERLTWITNGTPTSYDVVFGPVIERMKKACNIDYDKGFFLKYAKFSGLLNADERDLVQTRKLIARDLKVSVQELEKKVLPLEALYAIADHSRALAFAIAGAGLPSNVGGGYNLRVILRRALNFIEKFKWQLKLEDIALWHVDYLKKIFPELDGAEDEIVKILQVEEKRYNESKERSKRIVDSFRGKQITEEDLIKLYDSQGVTPEEVGIEVPTDFYKKVTERHMGEKEREEKFEVDISDLKPTKILYYEHPPVFQFNAKVVSSFNILSNNWVVLDQTGFYPTSGGQKHDKGTINELNVLEVRKIGSVILHQIDGSLEEDTKVSCKVDEDRRQILRRHHDSVHIINASSRKDLGEHINQFGSEKNIDKARIDITHYEALTEKQLEEIENTANEIVLKKLPIKKTVMGRSEAEKKYGFRIYQGGYVPSKEIRIVSIGNFDVEACGGTHGENTYDVFPIVITKSKRVADGLVRIELTAADIAINNLKEKEKLLEDVAKSLNVKENDVPKAVEKIFNEWKEKRKGRKK